MELLYNRIFWCEIADPIDSKKNIRIFCDRNGEKVYIEQDNNIVEMDVVAQASIASFLVSKMFREVAEYKNIPKDVTKNI